MNSLNIPECPPEGEQLPPMSKRTLLQKYEIPVSHLDFEYVRDCQDAKEVERMLLILRSGEEGYFPDLQQCTEQRLRVLNPRSKLLREEEPMRHSSALPKDEQEMVNAEISGFFKDIHKIAEERKSFKYDPSELPSIPSIRKPLSANDASKAAPKPKDNRIRSCDYAQWDKYDADTELTKLDLSAERNREAAEVTEIKKANAYKNLANTVGKTADEICDSISRMSPAEREKCANDFRIQGNEQFKAGEFEEAVLYYSRSLAVMRTSVAFSNRAMAYLKLKKNNDAIRDCNECLEMDVGNVKAMLRKGQALINEDRKTEAFKAYSQALSIDSNNAIAAKALADLRKQIGEIPLENAFRMKIVDDSNEKNNKPAKTIVKNTENHLDVDFAELIIPKKIVPSRMSKMAETMKQVNQMKPMASRTANSQPPKQNQANIQTKPKPSTLSDDLKMPLKMPKFKDVPKKTTKYSNGVIIEEL